MLRLGKGRVPLFGSKKASASVDVGATTTTAASATVVRKDEKELRGDGWKLDDALEALWRKPISELSCYVDIFRLSSRITVVAQALPQGGDSSEATPAAEARVGIGGVFDLFFAPSVPLVPGGVYRAAEWGQLPYEGWVMVNDKLGSVSLFLGDVEIACVPFDRVVRTQDSSRYYALLPEPSKTPKALCANCDDGETLCDAYCPSCDESLCRECDAVLHRRAAKRAHVRKPVSGFGIGARGPEWEDEDRCRSRACQHSTLAPHLRNSSASSQGPSRAPSPHAPALLSSRATSTRRWRRRIKHLWRRWPSWYRCLTAPKGAPWETSGSFCPVSSILCAQCCGRARVPRGSHRVIDFHCA